VTLDDAPDPMKVEELAKVLRIGQRQAYELVRSGGIYGARIGRVIRIPKAAVRRFLEGGDEYGQAPHPRLAVVGGAGVSRRDPRRG
jgi:excisionase family DNA binding protein